MLAFNPRGRCAFLARRSEWRLSFVDDHKIFPETAREGSDARTDFGKFKRRILGEVGFCVTRVVQGYTSGSSRSESPPGRLDLELQQGIPSLTVPVTVPIRKESR